MGENHHEKPYMTIKIPEIQSDVDSRLKEDYRGDTKLMKDY